VKGNSNQQDDKGIPNRHAKRHTNENAMKQNADFKQNALQDFLLQSLLGREETDREANLGVGIIEGRRNLHGLVGRIAPGKVIARAVVAIVCAALDPSISHRDDGGRGTTSVGFNDIIVEGGARPITSRRSRVHANGSQDRSRGCAMRKLTGGAEHHLDDDDEEDASQRNSAGHGGVIGDPKGREARVSEGKECGGQEVHESRGDEDASSEVPDDEEEGVRDLEGGEAPGNHGEAAGERGDEHDDEQGSDVQGHVVFIGVDAAIFALVPLGEDSRGKSALGRWGEGLGWAAVSGNDTSRGQQEGCS